MVKIVLDAGHGLGTPGKRLLKSLDKAETREWVLNNRIANHVENLLKGYEGTQVLRVDDKTGKRDVPLSERTRKANNWKADIYISIHHDAGANGSGSGGVTAYRYPNSSRMTRAMLQSLYNSIVKHNKLKGNRASPLNEANFAVLRQTNMAAALIENGFMDSRTDVPIILSDAHARKTAEGIVEFVVNHYRLRPRIKETKGKATLAEIKKGITEPKGYFQRGDTGKGVEKLQQDLVDLGGYRVEVNGKFDSNTRDKVTIFQRRNNLKDDGIAGKETLAMLEKLLKGTAKLTKVVVDGKQEGVYSEDQNVIDAVKRNIDKKNITIDKK